MGTAFNETMKQIQEHLALAQMKLCMFSGCSGQVGEQSIAIADQLAALEAPMMKLATISEGE